MNLTTGGGRRCEVGTYNGAYVWRGSRTLIDLNAAIMAARGDNPKYPRTAPAPHGTINAARRHRRRGESICEACRQAVNRDRQDRSKRRRERKIAAEAGPNRLRGASRAG